MKPKTIAITAAVLAVVIVGALVVNDVLSQPQATGMTIFLAEDAMPDIVLDPAVVREQSPILAAAFIAAAQAGHAEINEQAEVESACGVISAETRRCSGLVSYENRTFRVLVSATS